MALLEETIEQRTPVALLLRVSQRLRRGTILQRRERVLPTLIVQAHTIHLAGKPLMTVEADVHRERKPHLQPQMQKSALLMQKVEVKVEAHSRPTLQTQPLLPAVLAQKESRARFE